MQGKRCTEQRAPAKKDQTAKSREQLEARIAKFEKLSSFVKISVPPAETCARLRYW